MPVATHAWMAEVPHAWGTEGGHAWVLVIPHAWGIFTPSRRVCRAGAHGCPLADARRGPPAMQGGRGVHIYYHFHHSSPMCSVSYFTPFTVAPPPMRMVPLIILPTMQLASGLRSAVMTVPSPVMVMSKV